MNSTLHRARLLTAAAVTLAAALAAPACGPVPPPQPPDGGPTGSPTPPPPTAAATAGDPTQTPPDDPTQGSEPEGPPILACRLPAPKKSADACATDADCGVSEPCHAAACVAKAKSHPPDAGTVCTRRMDCHTADANPCRCFESVCALVPPPQ